MTEKRKRKRSGFVPNLSLAEWLTLITPPLAMMARLLIDNQALWGFFIGIWVGAMAIELSVIWQKRKYISNLNAEKQNQSLIYTVDRDNSRLVISRRDGQEEDDPEFVDFSSTVKR